MSSGSAIVSDGNTGTKCPNKIGIGLFDLAVHFADIDGDGQADYLCLDLDGPTTANIAEGGKGLPSKYADKGQVKYPIGADRANINRDGKNPLSLC